MEAGPLLGLTPQPESSADTGPTRDHAQNVHYGAAAEDDREGEEDPREVGRREIENPQEAQADVGMPPPPHIHLQPCIRQGSVS